MVIPGPAVLLKSTWGIAGVALVLALLMPIGSRAQAPGVLAGTVTDSRNVPLPGATVVVTTRGVQRTAIAGAGGRYRISNLPPGTYTAKAALPGFETAVENLVVVEAGTTTALSFALQVGCISEVVLVDMGLAWALEEASAIVHVRILESESSTCLARGFCVCTEHVAAVVGVVKSRQPDVPLRTIRFVQEGAGHIAENGATGAEEPYAPGQEYVAFLRWDATTERFVRAGAFIYMFPVRDGRVEFRRTDAPGMSDGMPVEEFSRDETTAGGWPRLIMLPDEGCA